MEIINQYHQIAAVFIARVFLGLLFFFQGFDAIFNIKIKNVLATYEDMFQNKGIPSAFTKCAVWFTTYTELIGGILLILGLFEYWVLFILGLNVLIASIGFGMVTPMWDTRFVFPRLVLLLFLLLIPSDWNLWSLDYLFTKF